MGHRTQMEGDIAPKELQRRVIYTLLHSAVRLSGRFGISLKELRGLMDAAYFEELRASGKTHREIAQWLQVSERTTVKLSRQVREQFMDASIHHSLPMRIEFMLGAEPMGEGRIIQVMPDVEPEVIKRTLTGLLTEGRIREVAGRTLKYAPSADVRSLPRDTWLARLGGLSRFTENMTNAVYGRFFKGEPKTFARTLTFQGNAEVFEALSRLYGEVILPSFQALHVPDVGSGEGLENAQVSICWAPYEYSNQVKDDGERDVE